MSRTLSRPGTVARRLRRSSLLAPLLSLLLVGVAHADEAADGATGSEKNLNRHVQEEWDNAEHASQDKERAGEKKSAPRPSSSTSEEPAADPHQVPPALRDPTDPDEDEAEGAPVRKRPPIVRRDQQRAKKEAEAAQAQPAPPPATTPAQPAPPPAAAPPAPAQPAPPAAAAPAPPADSPPPAPAPPAESQEMAPEVKLEGRKVVAPAPGRPPLAPAKTASPATNSTTTGGASVTGGASITGGASVTGGASITGGATTPTGWAKGTGGTTESSALIKPLPIRSRSAQSMAKLPGHLIHVGSFADEKSALPVYLALSSRGYPVRQEQIESGGKPYVRLFLGPYPDPALAREIAQEIDKALGLHTSLVNNRPGK